MKTKNYFRELLEFFTDSVELSIVFRNIMVLCDAFDTFHLFFVCFGMFNWRFLIKIFLTRLLSVKEILEKVEMGFDQLHEALQQSILKRFRNGVKHLNSTMPLFLHCVVIRQLPRQVHEWARNLWQPEIINIFYCLATRINKENYSQRLFLRIDLKEITRDNSVRFICTLLRP